MKIIYNRILPVGRRFHAINLFGILFAKGPCDRVMINHEKIHTAQMREFLFIGFYLLYILEWLFRLFQYRNLFLAYRNISFEREAYSHEADLQYLTSRPRFASLRYLKS
ncbi:MAG: hypothetical protein K2J70_05835 [Muribaculaceae bacterium]|nr:hypothetical protein [Muribaculaceae bacterium]